MVDEETMLQQKEYKFQELFSDIQAFPYDKDFRRPRVVSQLGFLEDSLSVIDDSRGINLLSDMLLINDIEIEEMAVDIVSRNLENIITRLDPSEKTLAGSLTLLGDFVRRAKDDKSNAVRNTLKEKIPALLETQYEETDVEVAVLENALQYGDVKAIELAKSKIVDFIATTGNLDRDGIDTINGKSVEENALYRLINSRRDNAMIFVIRAIAERLDGFGLDGYALQGLWRRNSSEGSGDLSILLNLANINDLEKDSPKSARKLFEQNNIHHFGRWPIEVLKSHKEGNKVLRIVNTTQDQQGAFYDHHTFGVYKELSSKLPDDTRIEIYEVDPEYSELTSTAAEADTTLLYIHGQPKSLFLGYDQSDEPVIITADDIDKNPNVLGFSTIKEGSRLVLVSCSTGSVFENSQDSGLGIGQSISKLRKIKVSAPVLPAGVSNIDLVNGVIMPNFVEGNSFDGKPVKANFFNNGMIIDEDAYKTGTADL